MAYVKKGDSIRIVVFDTRVVEVVIPVRSSNGKTMRQHFKEHRYQEQIPVFNFRGEEADVPSFLKNTWTSICKPEYKPVTAIPMMFALDAARYTCEKLKELKLITDYQYYSGNTKEMISYEQIEARGEHGWTHADGTFDLQDGLHMNGTLAASAVVSHPAPSIPPAFAPQVAGAPSVAPRGVPSAHCFNQKSETSSPASFASGFVPPSSALSHRESSGFLASAGTGFSASDAPSHCGGYSSGFDPYSASSMPSKGWSDNGGGPAATQYAAAAKFKEPSAPFDQFGYEQNPLDEQHPTVSATAFDQQFERFASKMDASVSSAALQQKQFLDGLKNANSQCLVKIEKLDKALTELARLVTLNISEQRTAKAELNDVENGSAGVAGASQRSPISTSNASTVIPFLPSANGREQGSALDADSPASAPATVQAPRSAKASAKRARKTDGGP